MEGKRARKTSKRLSESKGVFEEDAPPVKKPRRSKSSASPKLSKTSIKTTSKTTSGVARPNKTSLTKAKNSKKLIVSVDFASNVKLSLGGVPLSKLNSQMPVLAKGQRSNRSECSSPGGSEKSGSIERPVKLCFKNSKFCFSYLASNKKKAWKNLKQIMTVERGLGQGCSVPTYSSLDAPPLLKPARKYSDLSGLLAKYTDPQTGIHFNSANEFSLLRTLPSDIIQSYLALRGKMTIT